MEEPQYSDILGDIIYNKFVLNNLYRNYRPYVPKSPKQNEKPMKKCLREACEVLTNHNGGYCSANCCKEDRKKN